MARMGIGISLSASVEQTENVVELEPGTNEKE